MLETDLLLLWLPGRQLPGAVEAEAGKRGLTVVNRIVEPEAREFYRDLGGLLLSVVGWEGEWTAAGVLLPRPVHGLIDGLVAAHPEGFEAIVWGDTPQLDVLVAARRDMLHGPWRPGVRYQVYP